MQVANPLSTLTRRARRTLERYKRALPDNEYLALTSWLSTFFPFQIEWLLDDSKRAICNKSRQIGMSHTTSALAVIWGVFHGELTTVVSIGEAEAIEVLDKAKRHVEILTSLDSKMAKLVRNRDTGIGFASHGRILALPSTGGRGYSGNVFLDEFAYHTNPQKVWDATAPATNLGFRMRVASTPNGFGNDFHLLWRAAIRGELDFSTHETPIELAVQQGFPVDVDECWQLAKGDPRLFAQMYQCKFLDNELQYVPSDLVEACSGDCWLQSGDYYAGLDIGKTVDKTVLTVVRAGEEKLAVQYIEVKPRTDPDELHAMVDRAFKAFNIKRLCLDSTGIGSFEADRMQKRLGYWAVEPVMFTLKVKEDLATRLYSSFAARAIVIPKTDESLPEKPPGLPGWPSKVSTLLREDICSIRREVTSAGNVRYDAPHTDKGHADSAWSLALAIHAAGQAQPRGYVSSNIAAAL